MAHMDRAALIQAWVTEHLTPEPGSRVRIATAQRQITRDLHRYIGSRELGRYVHATRSNGIWYQDLKLT